MKILAVDTSTQTGSVALLDAQTLLAEVTVTSPQTHARRLMSAIDRTFRMAGLRVESCDAFAVTTGPGSFTGLRIGLSTVKGFGLAMSKPVVGISTLDALAYQFPSCSCLVCPILDARKGQVYTSLFQVGPGMVLERVADECAVDPREWLGRIDRPCLFVGDGGVVYEAMIRQVLGDLARFAPCGLNQVRAAVVACMARREIVAGRMTDAGGIVPRYIRKSDAEMARVGKS